MPSLPIPPAEAVIFKNDLVTACLASFPITKGHTIVVWNKPAQDLHMLSRPEYDYLMDIVDAVRDALLSVLGVEKVYLLYMDEARQVHWHLVPRYDERGFNVFAHEPAETHDFSFASTLGEAFRKTLQERNIQEPV